MRRPHPWKRRSPTPTALPLGGRADTDGLADAPEGPLEPPRTLRAFFERSASSHPTALALIVGDRSLTYEELDVSANRLAHYLMRQGIGVGRRVGIYLDSTEWMYIALLGVIKSGAAYVPLDSALPAERVCFIAGDAQLDAILSDRSHEVVIADATTSVIALDAIVDQLAVCPGHRPAERVSDPTTSVAYVIYTSGSTGRPKGVVITQRNITTFLQAVLPVYGVLPSDRVYQGIPISFDFSVEEIWPTWASGAALVARPSEGSRVGSDLNSFLTSQRVSVLHIVPTLLATLDEALPTVRLINVGGEPCPSELVDRFATGDRTMLNTYGPSEATVTATWARLLPGLPVTIGRPLPSHSTYVLNAALRPVDHGQEGELCIGGPCVAAGYLNRDALTAEQFVADPFSTVSGARMYRTGDLVRTNPAGDIEYLGRNDSQVKLRGYRVELGEIEAVIAADSAVRQAVVAPLSCDGRVEELAAYVVLSDGEPEQTRRRIHRSLKRRLPVYMVPAYIEVLDALPLQQSSSKLDRSSLPLPSGPRLIDPSTNAVAVTATEKELSATWGEVLGLDQVPVDADFFLDLGGHSLFAALVMARLRRDPSMAELSIADMYRFPTVRELAAFIDEEAGSWQPRTAGATASSLLASSGRPSPRWRRVRCGAAQAMCLCAMLALFALPSAIVLGSLHGQLGFRELIILGVVVATSLVVESIVLPALAVRPLLDIEPGSYPLWGVQFFRIWLATKFLAAAPMGVLAASPLLPHYLRIMGAKIGRDAQIATPNVVLPRFVEIGDGASIGYGADLQPYFVEGATVHLAPIVLGPRSHVGTYALVMAGACVEEGAILSDLSLLSSGEVVPAGGRWSGSPARPSAERDPVIEAMRSTMPREPSSRTAIGSGYALGALFFAFLPFLAVLPAALLLLWAWERHSVAGLVGYSFLAGPVFVTTLCTLAVLLKRALVGSVPSGTHPLRSAVGLRKWLGDHFVFTCLTSVNSLFATLYTPLLLRGLGARIGRRSEVSTVAHIDSDCLVLDDECFIADLAALGPARQCNGQVSVARTYIGKRSFVGNAALVSNDTHVGARSLIGVLSTPPAGRPVEPETDWLGSPAIFLPRRQPSGDFPEQLTFRPRPAQVAGRLFIEFWRATLPSTLFILLATGIISGAFFLAPRMGRLALLWAVPGMALMGALVLLLIVIALKWIVVGRYRPRVAPLWALFVRRSEFITGMYESAAVPAMVGWLTGTPLVGPVLRLFGVHIGRGTYLDTTFITEFDLLSIGDHTSIGMRASLQTHLFEDRVMKMSTVDVGPGCTVGSRAVILYDAHIEAGARLAPLSLVMKGETLPSHTSWRGVPVQAER